ncbi:hypothetical protein FPE01S_02_08690 [Flavihumibacter petaseus NBRC 106054]|uniref:Uncharacterized protein n=2 Tax=Flavihumibacter TaxID=1004301 RepID=A0A0E9N1V8_9BACT|nr:hypothetical protein FPE01S_02_08690 [Flavihumibacter petaseus NBRC 106054]
MLIYQAVFDAYRQMKFIRNAERIRINPAAIGLSIENSIHFCLTEIKKMLPSRWEVNVEKEGDKYLVVIYFTCELNDSWNIFEAGPIIRILEQENPKLLGYFLQFLSAMVRVAAIGNWQTDFQDDLFNLRDRVEEMWADPEEYEDLDELTLALNEYNAGAPDHFGRKILNIKKVNLKKLQQQARRFRSCPEVANVICQGCELLMEGRSLAEYRNMDRMEKEGYDGYYLQLDLQYCVVWKYADPVFDDYEEYLNSMANEGLEEPEIRLVIDQNLKLEDILHCDDRKSWPMRLANFMDRAKELLVIFKSKYEPTDGRADEDF